jgi:lipoprotein Spr
MLSGKYLFSELRQAWLLALVVSVLLSACSTQRKTSSASNSSGSLPRKSSGLPTNRSESDSKVETTSSAKKLEQKYSILLGVSPSEIDNLELYQFIDEWTNVPYKYGGRTKAGVDCSGISTLLEYEVYRKNITGSSATIFRQVNPVSKENLKEGDLVFFKINSSDISHMGVYLTNNKFVHCLHTGGCDHQRPG